MRRFAWLLALPLSAQVAPSVLKFEVASVKLHQGPGRIQVTTSGPRWNAEAEGLWSLILYAYNLKNYQLSWSGPVVAPFADNFYDVAAKAEGDGAPSPEEFREMLRSLLADRFQLRFHREPRELPVYHLLVAHNGPKLKPSARDPAAANHFHAEGRNWEAFLPQATIGDLVDVLDNSAFLGRPAFDKTGLSGTYEIHLTYTPDIPPNRRGDPDPNDITIFRALQDQLGLKLEPQKAMFDVLIVDRLAKPSEN